MNRNRPPGVTCGALVLAAILALPGIALAGQSECLRYEECRKDLVDDAALEARHRCQSGSRGAMMHCRDAVRANYIAANQDRCAALLTACGRADTNVRIEVPAN